MIRKNFMVACALVFAVFSYAQPQVFTLQKCINTALENNLSVTQWGYDVEKSAVDLQQSRLNMLPNVNANINHSNNRGRSIDPSTNTFIAQKFYAANFNLNGDITLFQGLTLRNLVRQRSMDYAAAKMDWQQQKDNITISIILAYLQMMNTQDMVQQMQAQQALSQQQENRLVVLHNRGAIAPAMLYDVQAELASDKALLVQTNNTLEIQRIALCRLMNISYEKNMIFERETVDGVLREYTTDTKAAYERALVNFSKVKAAEYRRRSAEEAVKVAKGSLWPTMKFGWGWYSNYSSASQGAYFGQLNNNLSSMFGLSLQVPVFNALRARNEIKRAAISLKDVTRRSHAVKTELQQDIEEAYNNVTAAFERYRILLEQVRVLKMSFGAAEAKFNVGQGSSIDYLIVKNNMDRAAINLISAKYDYLLRVKVYEYYQGVAEK